VGGSTLTSSGWLPMMLKFNKHSTVQPLYFCKNVDRIYLSRKGCTELKILPQTFPFLMDQQATVSSIRQPDQPSPTGRPTKLSYPATEDNITKLKE